MITINLLPAEFRRKLEEPRIVSLRFGMIFGVLVCVLLWLGVSFMVGTSKREFDNYSNDWKRLEASAKEADKIMTDINQNYLEREKVCDLILASDVSWAYVLNQLSDLLPSTAWLKKIKLSSSGLEDWEFGHKGMILAKGNEPPIKVIGHYVGAIKPALEQPLKTKKRLPSEPGSDSVASSQSELNVQTSTNQEVINDVPLTSFEATFTMKEKENESVRDKSKTA